jgi:hypothetical protein
VFGQILAAAARGYRNGRVNDLIDVYAAGDATAFSIKQAVGPWTMSARATPQLASQVALVRAGHEQPAQHRFEGLRRDVGAGARLRCGDLWWPPGKLAAHYLAPSLARLAADRTRAF